MVESDFEDFEWLEPGGDVFKCHFISYIQYVLLLKHLPSALEVHVLPASLPYDSDIGRVDINVLVSLIHVCEASRSDYI